MVLRDLKEKYAVVGIGYTPQGKVPGRTALSFHLEACANAIADAGLEKRDIDGLICYRRFSPLLGEPEVTPYLLAQMLGITPRYLTQEANCARTHLFHAMAALQMGLCNYVLISYADNAVSGRRTFIDEDTHGEPPGDLLLYGQMGFTANYAMAARRAIADFNTGPDTWREIAVAQRRWAALNPRAALRNKPITYDDYYNSPMVTEPFRLCDACLVSDGGRALVVTSVERARDLEHPVVAIMGLGMANPSCDVHQSPFLAGPTGARDAGRQAFEMAGITPAEIDACQIYDCFTYTVEITLQDYGFFEPGEGRDWFKDGATAPGGRMPVNTSGGLLAEAYFMGLTPLSEGVMQLMGRCQDRQLGPVTGTEEPNIMLVSDNGGVFQSHCCTILRRL